MRQEVKDQLKKEKFWEKIISMKTHAEVKKAFKEENIDISDEEIQEIGEDVYSFLKKLSKLPDSKPLNKLSDKEIENISGGIVDPVTATAISSAVSSVFSAFGNIGKGWFKRDIEREKTQQVKIQTELQSKQLDLSYTWKGMVHDNPGYTLAAGIAGAVGAAYMAKVVIRAIKEGNLLKWFEADDDDYDYE